MKSLEELENLREKLKKQMKVREGKDSTVIAVGMGTCGIAAGARQVMKTLLTELNNQNVSDVLVTQTSCLGLCQYEPVVQVDYPGQEKVTYINVDEEKIKRIVSDHLLNGQIVKKWTIKD